MWNPLKKAITAQEASEEAVLIRLDALGLGDSIDKNYDLRTLENQVKQSLGSFGVYDGNEFGEGETTIFLWL